MARGVKGEGQKVQLPFPKIIDKGYLLDFLGLSRKLLYVFHLYWINIS